MRAGAMNERIELRQSTKTRDAVNALKESWATVATVWASVRETGAREDVVSNRPMMIATYEIEIRTGGTVTPNHKEQIVWRTKTLEIDTVTVLQSEGKIRMSCTEVVL